MDKKAKLSELTRLKISEEKHTIHHAFPGIGAGLGGGFVNTQELKAMKYNEDMEKDKEVWDKVVEEEHHKMVENEVWRPVKLGRVKKGSKVLNSNWVCKLKANVMKWARINGCGYEQVD